MKAICCDISFWISCKYACGSIIKCQLAFYRKHVSTDEKYLSAQLRSQSLQNKNHVSICVWVYSSVHQGLACVDWWIPSLDILMMSLLLIRLPTEVLLYIFQYLDASDLLIAARVCRDWLSIANDKWVSLHPVVMVTSLKKWVSLKMRLLQCSLANDVSKVCTKRPCRYRHSTRGTDPLLEEALRSEVRGRCL